MLTIARGLIVIHVMSITWPELIDSTSSEIHQWARDVSLPEKLGFYARALSYYLQGDRERLRELAVLSSGCPHIDALVAARLKIRERAIVIEDLQLLGALPHVLEGERHFLLAQAHDPLGELAQVAKHYSLAAKIYREQGCPKKAARSDYNAIVADSRRLPHKSYVFEYQAVIDQSRRTGDTALEGMALIGIAREYQIQGLFTQALKMAEHAVDLLELERGSIHFGHALLQKAHVMIDLHRESEVLPLILEAEMAPFPEVLAAAKLLRTALDPARVWDRAWENDLMPTWRNRVPQLTTMAKVGRGTEISTELEERLLKIVYNGPVDKWDLIERLYPKGGAPLALENRLKNLLNRVRRKYPEKIVCSEGRYSIEKLPGELI